MSSRKVNVVHLKGGLIVDGFFFGNDRIYTTECRRDMEILRFGGKLIMASHQNGWNKQEHAFSFLRMTKLPFDLNERLQLSRRLPVQSKFSSMDEHNIIDTSPSFNKHFII
ncbi:hypothetical protein LXL04_016748 [Taraxacum kok-saghyz]